MRQGLPSSLQQPNMRQALWQVAEASCAVCTSLRKSALALADAPAMLKLFTATCRSWALEVTVMTRESTERPVILVFIPGSCIAPVADLLHTG